MLRLWRSSIRSQIQSTDLFRNLGVSYPMGCATVTGGRCTGWLSPHGAQDTLYIFQIQSLLACNEREISHRSYDDERRD